MDDVQRKIRQLVDELGLEASPAHRLLDLTSEVGELAKEHLKATDYGRVEFRPDEAWASELGDVLFALGCLANATDVDLGSALETVLAKYRDRVHSTGAPGSGR